MSIAEESSFSLVIVLVMSRAPEWGDSLHRAARRAGEFGFLALENRF